MRGRKSKIDWGNIKVKFIRADPNDLNPMNPCSHLTPKERREELIEICAKIWMEHCNKMIDEDEKNGGE